MGALVLVSQDAGIRAVERQNDQTLDLDAERLAQSMLGSPGVGWYSTVSCVGGAATGTLDGDNLQRFGLGAERCGDAAATGAWNLSFAKLSDLASATFSPSANDHADYEDARRSLGLDSSGYEFHLRTWPLMPSVEAVLGTGYRDPYSRVAYIGDYRSEDASGPVGYEIQKSCGFIDSATSVLVYADVTNNGSTPTAVEGTFSVPLDDSEMVIADHTASILPTATARLSATLKKSADWDWDGAPTVSLVVSDILRDLGSCTIDLTGVTMTLASTTKQLTSNAASLESLLSGGSTSLKVYYEAYDGEGSSVSYSDWKLEVRNSLGALAGSDASLSNRGWETFTLTLPDTYKINLLSVAGTLLDTDNVTVGATSMTPFTPSGVGVTNYQVGDAVEAESAFVAALVQGFSRAVYNATYDTPEIDFQAGGDVYPDLKTVLNNDLAALLLGGDGAGTLAHYNAIVVGSNVDHNAMTSAAAKQAIRDWVFAGGFLIVFGSDEQSVTWLQPIFHSAISSASGGISTPDATHPVLHTPNELDYASFATGGLAWRYNSGSDAYFTHVVKQGADDVLGVSEAGAFGEGGVLLSTWRPYDLQGGGATGVCDPDALSGSCPALQLVHNYLVMGYRDLYVDYGPAIPEGQDVAVSRHIATTFHPELGQHVDLAVQVFVFR